MSARPYVSTSLCICPGVCTSLCLCPFVFTSLYLYVLVSVRPCVCTSLCLYVLVSVRPYIYTSLCTDLREGYVWSSAVLEDVGEVWGEVDLRELAGGGAGQAQGGGEVLLRAWAKEPPRPWTKVLPVEVLGPRLRLIRTKKVSKHNQQSRKYT